MIFIQSGSTVQRLSSGRCGKKTRGMGWFENWIFNYQHTLDSMELAVEKPPSLGGIAVGGR